MEITDETNQMKQPSAIKKTLKNYQLATLFEMSKLDSTFFFKNGLTSVTTNFAILSAPAGMGKTPILIALMAIQSENKCSPKTTTINIPPHYSATVQTIGIQVPEINDCTLIIVPDHSIDVWITHLNEWSNLAYCVIHQDNVDRFSENYEVVVCPASLFNRFCKNTFETFWNRVIIDDADSVVIPNMETPISRFVWLVTNNTDALCQMKNKGFIRKLTRDFDSTSIKNLVVSINPGLIKKEWTIPEPIVYTSVCLSTPLPGQKTLTLFESGLVETAVLNMYGHVGSLDQILPKLKLPADRQIDANCTICNGPFEARTFLMCCKNSICGTCLIQLLMSSHACPWCRAKISRENMYTEHAKVSRDAAVDKFSKLATIVAQYPNANVVVYSSDPLGPALSDHSIKWSPDPTATGTVVILNTEKYMNGWNLSHFNVIVIWSKYSPEITNQLIGRTVRIGQTRQVIVYKFEEKNI